MARDAELNWTLPTTRTSGRPITPAELTGTEVGISADGGANYALLNGGVPFPTSVLQAVVPELEPGVWLFSAQWVAANGGRSTRITATVTVEDTSPPVPGTLTVLLVPSAGMVEVARGSSTVVPGAGLVSA
jgi:hypothetical protein